jgi:amidase
LPEPGLKALKGARIAVITDSADFPVDRDISQACGNVASALADAGAKVTLDPPLPLPERQYYELYLGLLRGATSVRRNPAQLAQLAQKPVARDLNDNGYEALMLRGLTQSHRQWLEYANQRQDLRERWETFFGQHDALIAPVSPTTAFPHMQDTPKEVQTLSVNGVARPNADTYFWLGLASVPYLPSTTFPAGLSMTGLPIGLQIIGPEFADLACIALAHQLETLIGGFKPPPSYR